MYFPFELLLFGVLIVTAIVVLEAPSLIASIVGLAIFTLMTALLYMIMGAPDVAFTEAVINAGITGVYMIVALVYLRKELNG